MTQKKYCNKNCEDGWKTDRRYGVIYPPCLVEKDQYIPDRFKHDLFPHDDQWYLTSWETAQQIVKHCLYCDAQL